MNPINYNVQEPSTYNNQPSTEESKLDAVVYKALTKEFKVETTTELDNRKVTLTLPEVVVPQSYITTASWYGIFNSLQPILSKDPSVSAARAVVIMEALHNEGTVEKVWLFVRQYGMKLVNDLENKTQKSEFIIKLAKLLPNNDMPYWRNLAVEILSNKDSPHENVPCPRNSLLDLAKLFAKTQNLDETIYWLRKAKATKEVCNQAAEIFFQKGLFAEGLSLLDACYPSVDKSEELSVDEERVEQKLNQNDFVELLVFGLRNKHKLADQKYQKAIMQFKDDYSKISTILQAICYLGMHEQALESARQLCFNQKSIFSLLQISKFMEDEKLHAKYLNTLRNVAIKMSDSRRAIYDICTSKTFSALEDIETCLLLESVSAKLNILWNRACGITNKKSKDKSDLLDLRLVLSAMRTTLIQSTLDDDQGHPPYWVNVLKDYVVYGFIDEALKTGEMFKKWCVVRGKVDTEILVDLYFFSNYAVLEIATGDKSMGISDLKMAYELQKEDWIRYPNMFNNFALSVKMAIGGLPSSLSAIFQNDKNIKELIKSIDDNEAFEKLLNENHSKSLN